MSTKEEPIVVIGGGMAAERLLRKLEERQIARHVIAIGDEADFGYNRVLLPHYIAGICTADELASKQPTSTVLRDRVVSIDIDGHRVATEKGRAISYSDLVLATGSTARWPTPLDEASKGSGLPVFELRRREDADGIRRAIRRGSNVVVLGGGLLGLEAAAAMAKLGANVSVVHRSANLLNRQIDERTASLLLDELEKTGLTCHLNTTVAVVDANRPVVTLSDGAAIQADVIVTACGVAANDQLGRAAGLDCDSGIQVDRQLRTSDNGVYAIGECARVDGKHYALVGPVHAQAEALAETLAGGEGTFRESTCATRLKVDGISLFSAGDPAAVGEPLEVSDNTGSLYRKLVFQGDCLVFAVAFGDTTGSRRLEKAINHCWPDPHDRRALLYGDEPNAAAKPTDQRENKQ